MKWIIGILITLIIGLIPLYLHFANKAELKYTISSIMTIETSGGEQNWQLITLSNTGNKEADRIKIKIDKKILDYKIIPFLQTDKYQGNLSSKTLDIEYESLPPQGTIEIRLSVPSVENITNSNLNIVHDSGIATQATTKDRIIYFTLLILWITIFVGWIGISLFSAILYDKYRLRADAYSPYAALRLLKKKRPFFLSSKTWGEIRVDAVENAFNEDVYYQEQYKAFLNEDKPDYLNHSEYEKLVDSVSKKYANTFWGYTGTGLNDDVIDEIINKLKIKYPKNLINKYEKEIEAEAIIIFRKSFFCGLFYNYSPEQIEAKYKKIATSLLPEKVKKYCLETISDHYQYSLARMIFNSDYIEDFDKKYTPEILIEHIDRLERLVYKINMGFISDLTQNENIERLTKSTKPSWMKEYDFAKLKNIAEKILNLDKLSEEAESKVSKAEEKIHNAKKLTDEYESKVKIINSELQIVDNLLKDPYSISKVEEHSNPFAKGNFENLLKISKILLEK
jgi:hypothetical protein